MKKQHEDFVNENKGFSLVELIIVIAIMAILVGILAPQFLKYVNKARVAKCNTNVDTLCHEYKVNAATESHTLESANKELKKIMESHGGKQVVEPSTLYNGGVYEGICSEGKYQCMFSSDYTMVTIDCTKHGSIDIIALSNAMQNLTLDTKDENLHDFTKYLKGVSFDIDSTAINTGNSSYAPYSSLAEAINAALEKHGINISNRSWKLCRNGNSWDLYLANQILTVDDIGKTNISVTKYDIAKKEIKKGTVTVVKNNYGSTLYPIMGALSVK